MTATTFLDRVIFQATSAGTGDYVQSAAVTGFQTVQTAGGTNAQVYGYAAENVARTEWEVGHGTWTSATQTLARNSILFNSAGGSSATNFSSAPKVMLSILAEDLTGLNTSGWLLTNGNPGDISTTPTAASTNGNGMTLNAFAGDGDGIGLGGSANLIAGDGGLIAGGIDISGGNASAGPGGDVLITGGTGTSIGGSITIACGLGSSGQGGVLNLYGGEGDNGKGGDVGFTAGTSLTTDGGSFQITGGTGAGNGAGGDFNFITGQGAGTGRSGDFIVYASTGVGSGRSGLVFLNLPTANPHVEGALWANSKIVTVSTG
jgi:hypothetical protein